MRQKLYRFRLYVVGGHVGSLCAEPDLRRALDVCVADDYELELIDLSGRPDLAEIDRVIAAPTVIRLAPAPQRRAIGILADVHELAAALALPMPDY